MLRRWFVVSRPTDVVLELASLVLTLLAFLFALTLLIAVHEYGHYRMALAWGVPVMVFSIGFGKTIYQWRPQKQRPGQNTEFRIGALPLGGFIQMLDGRESDVPQDQRHMAFDQKSLMARASIVAAGPLANLLLAAVLFSALAWWGHPKVLPIIGRVEVGAAADKAGLQPGDLVLTVDSQEVRDSQHLRSLIRGDDETQEADKDTGQFAPVKMVWEIDRQGNRLSLTVVPVLSPVPGPPTSSPIRRIGAVVGVPSETEWVRAGFWDGLGLGFSQVKQIALMTGQLLGKMLTGEATSKHLSGPLTIAEQAGQSAQRGLFAYTSFLALISVSLGLLNLLPLPMLDGGHLMYYLWESLTGKPVSVAWQRGLQKVGLALLIFIMSLAFFNDLTRLFN
ncbi:MAG: Metalloprotease MmpA [Pseudomonadota bacterium]|jgi:membrane-associated protease RseP (regulator of RpoE activity)